ncbi:translation initiation factor IF-2-like [Moschus berezovskii]|uniref:translation initiation factor IF-2-like n=1 Tax=Moschus berezovskii TaxID=68408 RepID=UPI0024437E71|nr:translation initiation factor IF-2-like [Moschus berezovskii]
MVEEASSGPRFGVRGSQRPRLPGARKRLRNSAGSRGPEIVLGFGRTSRVELRDSELPPRAGSSPGRNGYLRSGWAQSHRQLHGLDPPGAFRFGPAGPPVAPEPRGTGNLAPAPGERQWVALVPVDWSKMCLRSPARCAFPIPGEFRSRKTQGSFNHSGPAERAIINYKDSASTPQDAGKSGIWERLPWMVRPGRRRVAQEAGRRYLAPMLSGHGGAPVRRPEARCGRQGRAPLASRCAALRPAAARGASACARRGPRALGLVPRSESPPSPGSGRRWSGRGFPRPEPRAQPGFGPAARARGRPRGPGGRSTEHTGIAFAFFLFRLKLDLFIFYLQRSKNSIHRTRQPWENPKK